MLSRGELLTALRAQRARRDELLGVDAQQWAWHCGACYAIAAALGIDPGGPIPDDPEPEPELGHVPVPGRSPTQILADHLRALSDDSTLLARADELDPLGVGGTVHARAVSGVHGAADPEPDASTPSGG